MKSSARSGWRGGDGNGIAAVGGNRRVPPPPPDLMGMEESAAACGGGRGGGGSGRRPPIHHIRREGRRRQWPAVAGGEAAVAGGTLPSARSCGRGGDGGDRLPTPRRRRWCPPQRRTFFMFLVFLVFLNDLGLVGVFLDVIGLVRVKGSCFEPMHRAYFFFFDSWNRKGVGSKPAPEPTPIYSPHQCHFLCANQHLFALHISATFQVPIWEIWHFYVVPNRHQWRFLQ